MPSIDSRPRLRFGDWLVDPRAGELRRGDERIPLQDKPLEVLLRLLETPGEVVLREELQERLWPNRIVEFDNNLNTALAKLRRALDDDAEAPRWIETVPRRGYRFLGSVEAEEGPVRGGISRSRRLLGALGAAGVAGAILGTLLWPGRAGRDAEAGDPDPPGRVLVAVLPLGAPGGVAADRALAEILTEELISRLASLLPEQVGVIARTSALRYRDAAVDLRTLRTELGVDWVLEGSVRRVGDRLRLHARLVSVADQTPVWVEVTEEPLEGLPGVEVHLARRIAESLVDGAPVVISTLPPAASPTPESSVDSEAWREYLQGLRELRDDEIVAAVASLERAVSLAPELARAWAALADAYDRRPGSPQGGLDDERAAARRAVELDPSLAEAWVRLGGISLYHDLDWAAADVAFRRALAEAPQSAPVHYARAFWYSSLGRHEEALAALAEAERLDPLSVALAADTGWAAYVARRPDEALERCRRALELDPEHFGAYRYSIRALESSGRTEQAAELARRLASQLEAPAGWADAAGDEPKQVLAAFYAWYLQRLLKGELHEAPVSPGRLALARLDAGDEEGALVDLERAVDERSDWVPAFLAVFPALDPLRDDPRFEALLQATGWRAFVGTEGAG